MKQILIITAIIWTMASHSIAIADPLEREQQQACMNHLQAIGTAIEAYKAAHQGEVPDWLSDLYPKYLQDPQILLCPADKTNGSPARFAAYKDAKMPCSYLYEFNPMTSVKIFLFDFNPPKNLTFKESKRIQLKYFGGLVPIVICRHHGSPVINLGYNGEIYPSTGTWEYTPEAIRAAFSSFQSIMARNPDGWEREISLNEIDEYARRCHRVPELRVLLEKLPNPSAHALRILAGIYQSEGERDKTIETYQRLLNLVPGDIDARFQIAKLYATVGKYKEAREQCLQIIQSNPNHSNANALLAELDALQDGLRIQKALANMPTESPEMHYLVKLEETLFSAKEDLRPTIEQVQGILRESFGEPKSVAKLGHLYQTLDTSLAKRSRQWKTYTTSDGLISDHINAIAQDNRGILWIGTEKGICQYNGESFTRFIINEELRETDITSILIVLVRYML